MCILRGIIIFHNQDANASLPTKKGLKWGQPSILHEAKGGNNGHQYHCGNTSGREDCRAQSFYYTDLL